MSAEMRKVAIVDDESSGRTLIREYLGDFPNWVIIGEANNGVDAIKLIDEFKPDLVFLDVQMPGLTGFEVLGHLRQIPQIIFSTAYDQYAIQAFEVHAVDYLLKPYTKERFAKALKKLEEADQNKVGLLAESVLPKKDNFHERVLVNHRKTLISLAVEDIIWIEAYGDYAKIHCAESTYVSNHGISVLEERLNPKSFLRVHRSHIVNLKQVQRLDRYGKSYEVSMSNGDVVRVSRGYKEIVDGLIF